MACTTCQRLAKQHQRKKISGIMAKKAFSTSALQNVGFAAAGVLLARMANRVNFIAQNPLIGGAVKTGVGLFLTTQKNQMISNIGFGLAAAGATEVITMVMPDGAMSGVGYLTAAGSTSVHHVAGVPNVIID